MGFINAKWKVGADERSTQYKDDILKVYKSKWEEKKLNTTWYKAPGNSHGQHS